jgi:hypothetical protein
MPMTKQECDLASALGNELASQILPAFQGRELPVLFNTLGELIEAVFAGMNEQGHPLSHVLEEFDHWTAYTRSRIETELKGRMS